MYHMQHLSEVIILRQYSKGLQRRINHESRDINSNTKEQFKRKERRTILEYIKYPNYLYRPGRWSQKQEAEKKKE